LAINHNWKRNLEGCCPKLCICQYQARLGLSYRW